MLTVITSYSIHYTKLYDYPDDIQTGLTLVANKLIDLGIDLVAFNPELEQFLN